MSTRRDVIRSIASVPALAALAAIPAPLKDGKLDLEKFKPEAKNFYLILIAENSGIDLGNFFNVWPEAMRIEAVAHLVSGLDEPVKIYKFEQGEKAMT